MTEHVPLAPRLMARLVQAACGTVGHPELVREVDKDHRLYVVCLRCGYESVGILCAKEDQ